MAREVDPRNTPRAAAALWMEAPMPMLTLFKTLDVTGLLRFSRRHRLKFHMLMCWCIGRATARSTSTPASVPLAFCLQGV